MLNQFRVFLILLALGCGMAFFASVTVLFPAVEEEPAWRVDASQASTTRMLAYLDRCRACLHEAAALAALDLFDRALGRVSVLSLERRDRGTEQIAHADLAPGGKTAVSVAAWGTLSVWDVDNGRRTQAIERSRRSEPEIRDVAMLADGQRFAAVSDVAVSVWGPGSPTPVSSLPLDGRAKVRQMRASSTAPDLAWITDEGGRLWHTAGKDVAKLEHPKARLLGFEAPLHVVTVSQSQIRRWRSDIGEFDGEVDIATDGHALALSKDGRHAYFWTEGMLEVWDTRTGAMLRRLALGQRNATAACASSVDTPLWIATDSGEVLAARAGSSEIAVVWRAHRSAIDLLQCGDDTGRFLSVGPGGAPAKVWERGRLFDAAGLPAAGIGAVPSSWNDRDADVDWRTALVRGLLHWRVLERMPALARWFDEHPEEIPPFAAGGFVLALVLSWLSGRWARR